MKKFKITVCIALVLCAIFVFSSCAKKEGAEESDISSVELKGSGENKKVKIKAEFTEDFVEENKGKKVHLIARSGDGDGTYISLGESKVKDSVEFEIPYEQNGKNHLNTAFMCAIEDESAGKFIPVTSEKYITNIADSGKKVTLNTPSSIKGLATDNVGHANYLGAQHILFEVRMDEILLAKYEKDAESVVSGGLTYYFDGEYVKNLDKKISQATDSGARVYLQFVLGKPEKSDGAETKAVISCLYFMGASDTANTYLPNLDNVQAQGYVAALFDFISSRYSTGEHGICVDYIIGKNANNTVSDNNAGNADVASVRSNYHRWVRIAYNSLISRVSNGKVYISLDNAWRTTGGGLVFLNEFNKLSRSGGDFEWHIALSYGNLSGDTVWESGDEYSEYFTANSLSDLASVVSNEDFMYKNRERSVIISSFSLKRNPEDEGNESRRSASFAYTYYATQKSGIVQALIYSSYEDATYGLLNSSGDDTPLVGTYIACSSDKFGELESLGSIIGGKWDSLKEGKNFNKICTFYVTPTDKKVSTANYKHLFDFSAGKDYGFTPAGGADYATLTRFEREDKSEATLLVGGGNGDSWKVLSSGTLGKSDINKSKYLGITLGTEHSNGKFMIIITGQAKKTRDNLTLCATATASGEQAEYIFDISDFSEKLSSSDVTFSICIPDSASGNLIVEKAQLYGATGSQVWKYVCIILAVIIIATGIFFGVGVLMRKGENTENKKRNYTSSKRQGDRRAYSVSDPKIKGAEELEKELDDEPEFDLDTGEGDGK